MSGTVWMFSDQIDDEDIDFMHRKFVTYNMASIYYGLGMKPVIVCRMNVGQSTKSDERY